MTNKPTRNSEKHLAELDVLFGKELAWFEIDRLSLNKNSYHNKSIDKTPDEFKKYFNYFYNNIPKYLYFLSITYVYFSDNNLQLKHICKLSGITRQTASQITKELQEMNLVKTKHIAQDGRAIEVIPLERFIYLMKQWSAMRYSYYSKFCFPKVFLSRILKDEYEKMSLSFTQLG